MSVARSRTFRSGNSEAICLPKDVAFGPGVELVLVPVTSPNRIPYLQARKADLVISTLGRTPAMANMVEGGKTPILTRDALGEIGFRLVISPGALVRAIIPAAESFLRALKAEGSTVGYKDRMTDLAGVNARIGLEEMLALGDRYEPERQEAAE